MMLGSASYVGRNVRVWYLQGVGDPGARLMFKFRSGTNGLNEEFGRHRGTNNDR